MRDFINKFGVYIVVVVLVAGVGIWLLRRPKSQAASPAEAKAFFYDEENGEESVRLMTEAPPMMNKDGKPTLVQAVKYTTDGGKTQKIAYLLKYTPEGKEAMDRETKTGEQPNINMMANVLVRSPEKDGTWVSSQSPQGEQLMGSFPSGEGHPEPVYPK